MIHPLGVYGIKKDSTLCFSEDLCTDLVLLDLKSFYSLILKGADDLIGIGKLFLLILDQGNNGQLTEDLVELDTQGISLGLGDTVIHNEGAYLSLRHFLDHLEECLVHIDTVDDLTSLLICDGPLDVHYIVVLKDILSCAEVHSLKLLLGRIDEVGKYLGLDLHGLVNTEGVIHIRDLITAEDTEEIVIEGKEELRPSGVTLSAGTALELIIDTP